MSPKDRFLAFVLLSLSNHHSSNWGFDSSKAHIIVAKPVIIHYEEVNPDGFPCTRAIL